VTVYRRPVIQFSYIHLYFQWQQSLQCTVKRGAESPRSGASASVMVPHLDRVLGHELVSDNLHDDDLAVAHVVHLADGALGDKNTCVDL